MMSSHEGSSSRSRENAAFYKKDVATHAGWRIAGRLLHLAHGAASRKVAAGQRLSGQRSRWHLGKNATQMPAISWRLAYRVEGAADAVAAELVGAAEAGHAPGAWPCETHAAHVFVVVVSGLRLRLRLLSAAVCLFVLHATVEILKTRGRQRVATAA